jgi:tRNA(Ile)-lysidine synthase
LKTLLAKIQRQRLFEPGETVVVAVSGGADSVALLDILCRLDSERLNLVVAHLNHGLRGDESDGDQDFVCRLAASYRLPFESRRVDVAALSQSLGLSLEDAGRRARYSFFEQVAENHGAASIALAHHRDDQAETVLIRLLRGAGGAGLSAMASLAQGRLKRPLLRISRAEIERYLKGRGITHRTDASNADTAILRNSIRHELIPFLSRYNPKISERLAATAEILGGDEELLEAITATAYARIATSGCADPTLAVEALAAEARGLRLRLYRRALSELRGNLQRIGLSHLEAIDGLVLSSRPNCRVKLPGDCLVSRSYDALRFTGATQAGPATFQVAVTGPGCYQVTDGLQMLVENVPRPASLDAGSKRVTFFDPAAAPFPWVVRSFTPGDRFIPLGMNGTQKVKELLMNEKIPTAERSRIPLLVSGGHILWVCGVRMGNIARVGFDSGPVLRVEILDISP